MHKGMVIEGDVGKEYGASPKHFQEFPISIPLDLEFFIQYKISYKISLKSQSNLQ